MVTQKVFIQETLTSHVLGWRFQDSDNGIGKDCRFAQIAFVGSVGFGCCGFDRLRGTLARSYGRHSRITYGCWPDTRNRHSIPPFPLPIHRKTNCQHTHANFTYRIRRLPTEKAAINRRTDNHNPPLATLTQVWQTSLHTTIESFGIDLLHQPEAFHRRVGDARPPDRSTVVH